MPTVTAAWLWVSLAPQVAAEAAIELDWQVESCPSPAEIEARLEAFGVEVVPPGAEPRADAARVLGRRAEGSEFVLVIGFRGREVSRVLDPPGSCEERAAVAAAIVERAIRPLFPGLFGPAPTTAVAAPERGPEPEPEPAPEPAPDRGMITLDGSDTDGITIAEMLAGKDTVEILRGGKLLLEDWEPTWVLGGALVAAGGVGPTFRAGADVEARYELTPGIFATLRLSYRTPLWKNIGLTALHMDDGAAALGVHVGAPNSAMAVQTTVVLQVVSARGSGFKSDFNAAGGFIDREIFAANPGITMGGCYQAAFETWGLEICARGFAFLRYQMIQVNDNNELAMPFMGGELSVGATYRLGPASADEH